MVRKYKRIEYILWCIQVGNNVDSENEMKYASKSVEV